MCEYLDMAVTCVYRPATDDFNVRAVFEKERNAIARSEFTGKDLQQLIYRLWSEYLKHWRLLNLDVPLDVPRTNDEGDVQLPLWS